MNAGEILAGLRQPGLDVAFVDETGTSQKPLTGLAADFVMMCAVVVPSEGYQAVKSAIQDALVDVDQGIREFHATEIVNPDSKSLWKGVPLAKRLKAFDFETALLVDAAESVLYTYISGEQYYRDFVPRILQAGGTKMDHKAALKKVFFARLPGRMRHPNRKAAVVLDSEVSLHDAIKIQDIREPEWFYEGGVIHAESWVEEGLQLADLAAYTLNRVFHVKQRRLYGKSGPFDDRIDALYGRLRPKLIDLLAREEVF